MEVPRVKETVGIGDTWAEPRASRSARHEELAARIVVGGFPLGPWEPREGDHAHGQSGPGAEAVVRAVSVVEVPPLGKRVFEFRISPVGSWSELLESGERHLS